MYISQTDSGDRIEVRIEPIENGDYNIISKSARFPGFDWKLEKKNLVFKLQMLESKTILGLISLKYFEEEKYIKITKK